MKKLIKYIFSEKKTKPESVNRTVSRDAKTGMFQVIERVDKQIGRAVTRLSER